MGAAEDMLMAALLKLMPDKRCFMVWGIPDVHVASRRKNAAVQAAKFMSTSAVKKEPYRIVAFSRFHPHSHDHGHIHDHAHRGKHNYHHFSYVEGKTILLPDTHTKKMHAARKKLCMKKVLLYQWIQ